MEGRDPQRREDQAHRRIDTREVQTCGQAEPERLHEDGRKSGSDRRPAGAASKARRDPAGDEEVAREGYRTEHCVGAGRDSDGAPSETLSVLRSLGISVALGHRADNVGPRVGAVVRSLAVPDDNPEIAAARERGLPIMSYPELGQIYKTMSISWW